MLRAEETHWSYSPEAEKRQRVCRGNQRLEGGPGSRPGGLDRGGQSGVVSNYWPTLPGKGGAVWDSSLDRGVEGEGILGQVGR